MSRISLQCQVQCSKCGWKSYRRLHATAASRRQAVEGLAGAKTYQHLGCTGVVLVKKVLGSHVLQ